MSEKENVKDVPRPASISSAVPQGQFRWYVARTSSGKERAAKKNLEQRVKVLDLEQKILQVVLPEQEEIQYKNGERQPVRRKMYPGYILLEMVMEHVAWEAVRHTPEIIDFVSVKNDRSGGNLEPVPLDAEEVQKIMDQINSGEARVRHGYTEGEVVRIKEGPFEDMLGTIIGVDDERGKATLQVQVFGRGTPMEVDFFMLERS